YNSHTNLIFRVVYSADQVFSGSSTTRFPDRNSPFTAHSSVSTNAVSPGAQADGRPFSEPAPEILRVSGSVAPSGEFQLTWDGDPGARYSIRATDNLTTPFAAIATQMVGADGRGLYIDVTVLGTARRFYQVSSP